MVAAACYVAVKNLVSFAVQCVANVMDLLARIKLLFLLTLMIHNAMLLVALKDATNVDMMLILNILCGIFCFVMSECLFNFYKVTDRGI